MEIGALLTTVNDAAQRVAMHAVRVEVLQRRQGDGRSRHRMAPFAGPPGARNRQPGGLDWR
jgi:hypothetical protein